MLLKNGYVVTPDGHSRRDIRIEGEIIREVGGRLTPCLEEEVLDLSGKVVFPGGVDVHTHMDLDLGNVRATDDFYTGTVAAAFGGTTTIVDHMAFGPKGCSISHQLRRYHLLAENKAVIDYGFHGVIGHVDDQILDELGALIPQGVTSHKIYLTYSGMLSDREILRLMEKTAELGVMLCVHCENDGAIAYLRDKLVRQGKTAPIYHARSRPPECEAEAINRMISLASMASSAPLYIVHVSSATGAECIWQARWRGCHHVFAETCPQYLYLDESKYLDADGLKYIMSPPLRPERHRQALWEAVAGGDVDVIATDHCPFFFSREKQRGREDFTKAPGGIPGVETRMTLLFSEIARGRLDFGQVAELCCTNPARLFGLYPKKGVIAPGSDADLAVFDPGRRVVLSLDILHENTDYTPYEGMEVNGYPVMTISRGEIIIKDGELLGKKGRGKYLRRGLPDLALRPPEPQGAERGGEE